MKSEKTRPSSRRPIGRTAKSAHSSRGRAISATEAARSFSDVLNRVQYRGETFVVERGRVPVCEIVPAAPAGFRLSDLAAAIASAPRPESDFHEVMRRILKSQPTVGPSPWER